MNIILMGQLEMHWIVEMIEEYFMTRTELPYLFMEGLLPQIF